VRSPRSSTESGSPIATGGTAASQVERERHVRDSPSHGPDLGARIAQRPERPLVVRTPESDVDLHPIRKVPHWQWPTASNEA
jgi:hypothetical protein